ncbi:MAG: hypothetical protein OXB88_04380 [Bacteriovoracales bacterium]|nr:hypothetical protein [Bacteriovoracales bacterium]
MLRPILYFFIFGSFLGCANLVSVSVSSIPKKRVKKVRVKTERSIFFLLNFNNDYINDLTEKLAHKCPRGRVKGVLTKHESITYFPFIAGKVRVSAEGYCVSGKRRNKKRRR